jgi:hypothetical protein
MYPKQVAPSNELYSLFSVSIIAIASLQSLRRWLPSHALTGEAINTTNGINKGISFFIGASFKLFQNLYISYV